LGPPQYIVNETTLILRFRQSQDYSWAETPCGSAIESLTRLLLSYILEYTHYILSISVTLNTQCLRIRDWLFLFSDCSCDWQMGGKKKGRVTRHATRAKPAHEGSDAEESESGALSGTSSEKQRLFETHAQLREAQQESLRLAGEIAEDDEADEDDDDDYDESEAQTPEDELATLLTKNAALRRQLQRRTGAATTYLVRLSSCAGRLQSCSR